MGRGERRISVSPEAKRPNFQHGFRGNRREDEAAGVEGVSVCRRGQWVRKRSGIEQLLGGH